jgi:cell division protein FtsL
VETKQLKRTVRRNMERFPDDFMFQLTRDEYNTLRSQFGTLKRGEHAKYLPFAFAENGVAMLSSILNSDKAIEINIQIMRVFNRFKKMYLAYDELKKMIHDLEQRQHEDKRALSDEIKNLSQILFLEVNRLEKLMKPSKQIGFKP